jgi:DNA invertase Pin-like site-specific DNA recombinase
LLNREAELLYALEQILHLRVTLPEVVTFYVRHHPANGNPTLNDLVESLIAEKKRIGRSDHYEKSTRHYLNKFMAHVGRDIRISDITREQITDAEFLLRLQNGNVDFVCCDCPMDRFSVGIVALFAQRDRELCSARTKAALQAAKKRGVRLGAENPDRQVRFMMEGYKRDRQNFLNRVRPIIDELKASGVKTLTELALCLTRRAIPTRTGKTVWFGSTVKTVIG